MNGVYKIPNLPVFTFWDLKGAMNEIDKAEESFDNNLEKFFDNLKRTNDQSGLGEKIQD